MHHAAAARWRPFSHPTLSQAAKPPQHIPGEAADPDLKAVQRLLVECPLEALAGGLWEEWLRNFWRPLGGPPEEVTSLELMGLR